MNADALNGPWDPTATQEPSGSVQLSFQYANCHVTVDDSQRMTVVAD